MADKEIVLKEIVDKETGKDATNSTQSFSGEIILGGENNGTTAATD